MPQDTKFQPVAWVNAHTAVRGGGKRMWRRVRGRWSRRGQSILEYLIVIGAILGVLGAISVSLKDSTEKLGNQGAAGIEKAKTRINTDVKSTEQ